MYSDNKGAEMTRKHFKAMALEISQMQDRKSARVAAEAFAAVASAVNPRFNFSRFYTACGV